ncbi:hypothetical protein [Variovorax paradoxus]|uniref:hypothetical protein n=1 Tax=Variovorax paradoxus TaxID=34073 RepID=UPI000A439D4E|nr:hypothetical protein [Variovorax paradoxus]
MYVQLSADGERIESWFAGPQDPKHWPNVTEIEANDPRYVAYYETLPAGARQGLPLPAP